MKRTQVRFQWQDPVGHRQFRTAVSLHSHTMHSRESLAFIPRYTAEIPMLAWEIRRQAKEYLVRTGKTLDYARAYWTPPLPGREAYNLERRQIEEKLGLAALVSLSDHDNIEAACQLRMAGGIQDAPISVEWTVPIGPTFFHIGVHNLPANDACPLVEDLGRYTRNPSRIPLKELLRSLSSYSDSLIVLNHPFWDQGGIGAGNHRALLRELFDASNGCIHALELNGLRPWAENQTVMDAADAWNLPVVSGGDRHGSEPNSIVNLTLATTFPEFVSEVRAARSEIAVLDHYREPRRYRILKSVCDIMRDYPELPGRVHWSDRTYCTLHSGATVPLSQVWNGNAPRVVRYFERTILFVGKRRIWPILRLCLDDGTTNPEPG